MTLLYMHLYANPIKTFEVQGKWYNSPGNSAEGVKTYSGEVCHFE